jgi:hypothetical protein
MAKLKWFRLYTEAVNDPKLKILSDKQFRIWFNLLCLAAEGEERGVVREEPFLLAVKVAGGDEQLLNETLVILERLKIVKNEHNSINFINFKKRQYEYRSSEPEEVNKRVGKCREQKKKKK